ncbi:MAG: hypothetical protein B7Z53_02855, partial [Rhodospirillales bacterium 12-71-4]
ADLFSTAGLAAGRLDGALGLLSGRLALVAGVVGLPIFLQSVGLGIQQAGDAALSADDAMAQWNETLVRLNPTLEQTARLAAAAAEAVQKARLAELEIGFGNNLNARGAAIARLPEIDGQILRAERAAAEAEARAVSLTIQASADAANPILRNRSLLGASSAPEADRATRLAADAREQVLRLREERLRVEAAIRDLSLTEDQYRNQRSALQGAIYGEQAGPPAPSGLGSALGGSAPSARDAERDEAAFQRAEDLARRTAQAALDAEARAQAQSARAQERADEQRIRQAERTTDSITRYLADGLTSAAQQGGFSLQAMLASVQQAALSTPLRIGVEAVIQPVVAGGVSALNAGGGVSGVLGGLANQFGLGGLLPSGGILANVNGLGAASGLFGNGVTFAANSGAASYGGFGLAGEGAVSGLFGPATLSSVLGGAGLGFGAGALLIGGNAVGGGVGSGLGGLAGSLAAGVGLLGPVGVIGGGLLGGLLGGGLGGVFGPGEKTNAFGFNLAASGGAFSTDALRTTGNGNGGAEVLAQAQQAVAQANAALAAAQLTVRDNRRAITGVNSADQSASFGDALGFFSYGSGNSTIAQALAAAPGAGLEEAVAISQFVTGLYTQLGAAAEPASEFSAAMSAIQQAFDPAIERARELTLSTDALVAAQQRQVTALVDQQRRAFRSATESTTVRYFRATGRDQDADLLSQQLAGEADIAGLRAELERIGTSAEDLTVQIARREEVLALERLGIQERYATAAAEQERSAAEARINASRGLYEQLAFGDLGGLSPAARAQAAQQALGAARGALTDGATTAEIAEYSRVATATLPVLRDYLGTSTAYAGVVGGVTATLREYAPEGDVAGLAGVIDAQTRGADQITLAVMGARDSVADLAERFDRLAAEVRAIAAKKG